MTINSQRLLLGLGTNKRSGMLVVPLMKCGQTPIKQPALRKKEITAACACGGTPACSRPKGRNEAHLVLLSSKLAPWRTPLHCLSCLPLKACSSTLPALTRGSRAHSIKPLDLSIFDHCTRLINCPRFCLFFLTLMNSFLFRLCLLCHTTDWWLLPQRRNWTTRCNCFLSSRWLVQVEGSFL